MFVTIKQFDSNSSGALFSVLPGAWRLPASDARREARCFGDKVVNEKKRRSAVRSLRHHSQTLRRAPLENEDELARVIRPDGARKKALCQI